ncbi:hypothetical protein NA56DRAFT_696943 [Hyaloscypha hepaticicola]|uniref:Uncharacterized protein n=1 Tax=Hyaloscypha hepaticicola TaxID=2082293 RepID=A0A2J6QNT2_9HELO|nr:hypothetical protein NA56DRAFT_696943 [Hyaloscypha hepaticicola]
MNPFGFDSLIADFTPRVLSRLAHTGVVARSLNVPDHCNLQFHRNSIPRLQILLERHTKWSSGKRGVSRVAERTEFDGKDGSSGQLLSRELFEQAIICPNSNKVPMGTVIDKPNCSAYGALEVDDRFSHRKVAPLSFPNSHTPADTPPPKSQLHQVVYYG